MLFLTMSQRFGFLDTNTFLHYASIDHIDWPVLLECDYVVLVLVPVVVRELNKHKDSPNSGKVRERAADALRKLHYWSDQRSPIMIRDSVELQFRVQDALIDFAVENLSPNIADDHLLASIIEFRQEDPSRDLLLLTEDLGLKLKARNHGIPVLKLPGDLRLQEELDADQKRIKQLEQEIRDIRDRLPVIKLRFRSGLDRFHLSLKRPATLGADSLNRSMKTIRDKYPKIEEQPKSDNLTGTSDDRNIGALAARVLAAGFSPGTAKKYNESLESFFEKYSKYLGRLNEFRNWERRLARLDIELSNEGTCPAEDIDIFMHFPDGFELLNREDLPKPPEKPTPPARPRTFQETLAGGFEMPRLYLPDLVSRTPTLPLMRDARHPSIHRTKSYDVELSFRKVKHGLTETLDPLFVVFESTDAARSFTIRYRLYAANLANVVEGQLHVIVELES
jgi:rRNA-processing protein FCF1